MSPITSLWTDRASSPLDAVGHLRSGMNVFVHEAAATPTVLLQAMVERRDLEGVRLFHMHLNGPIPFVDANCRARFRSTSLFTGPALREPIAEGYADFMPVFLSDIPGLFTNRRIPLDAALVQLSPPD